MAILAVAFGASNSMASNLDQKAAEQFVTSCFFPTGEEQIGKLPTDVIRIYMQGEEQSLDYAKERIRYFSSYLDSAKAIYSSEDVSIILILSGNIFADASRLYDKVFRHIYPSREEFQRYLDLAKQAGAQALEIYKFQENRFDVGTVVVQTLDDRDSSRRLLDIVLLKLFFPNLQNLDSATIERSCLALLDPSDPIGQWAGRFYNDPRLHPGTSLDVALSLLKSRLPE